MVMEGKDSVSVMEEPKHSSNVIFKKIDQFFTFVKSFREATILMIIFLFSLLIHILTPHFLVSDNIKSTVIGLSADGICVIGMTVALVSGGFDLSIGSIVALSGVIAGTLFLHGVNIWLACLVALLVCLLCGLINGLFIGKIGINPLIITLAMMGIARGVAYVLTTGFPQSISGVSDAFSFLGRGQIIGIPVMVLIFVLLAVFGDFMMRKSTKMRKVFYTGSNEKAAILSGIDTSNVKLGVYILSAFLASLAGLLTLARFGVAIPTAGQNSEMRAISAAVIGGASLSGGEGTILGAVLGVVLLNIINNALVLLKVDVYWQTLISGVILLLAVSIDHFTHKNKAKKIMNN
jgi:ribose transport system permease protein